MNFTPAIFDVIPIENAYAAAIGGILIFGIWIGCIAHE